MRDLDLSFEVHPGEGEHLLLVHGFLASRANWLPNLRRLATVSRPVVVELWGHGRSPAPTDPAAYSTESYVEALDRVRAAVGCERWFVCGHSMGAALTLRYALDHPDRVLGHIMMNSSSAVAEDDWANANRDRFAAEARVLAEAGAQGIRDHRLFPGHVRGLPPQIKRAFEADAVLHDPAALALAVRHTTPGSSSRARLAENRVPTLLVVGERESGFLDSRGYLEATMPHLEVVETDAGHAVNLEAPDAFDAAAVTFLAARSAELRTRPADGGP